jgi:hypothetical protein
MNIYWQEPALHLGSVLAVLGLLEVARSIPLQGQPAAAGLSNSYTLSGTIVDENRTPLPSAELTIARDGRILTILRTADDGAFSVDNLARGTIELRARRLGHRAETATLDLDRKLRREVMIVLERVASEVEPVHVSGRGDRLDQFYEHRKQNSFGRFMDREQIRKSGVRLTSDLFRTIPGATLRASRRYGNVVRFRGCQPIVWIDRVPIRDVELDEVTVPEEIAAIEIYTSSSGVPPEFMDRGGRSCGAIVVWTRIN